MSSMMAGMTLAAQPADYERLFVIIMVSLCWESAAFLARRFSQQAHGESQADHFMARFFQTKFGRPPISFNSLCSAFPKFCQTIRVLFQSRHIRFVVVRPASTANIVKAANRTPVAMKFWPRLNDFANDARTFRRNRLFSASTRMLFLRNGTAQFATARTVVVAVAGLAPELQSIGEGTATVKFSACFSDFTFSAGFLGHEVSPVTWQSQYRDFMAEKQRENGA